MRKVFACSMIAVILAVMPVCASGLSLFDKALNSAKSSAKEKAKDVKSLARQKAEDKAEDVKDLARQKLEGMKDSAGY